MGGSMAQRALLFSDVVDSTKQVQRLGDAAAAALWAEHDRRAQELLALQGGVEIDRSDGLFLLFDDVAAAARFAFGYHAALAGLGIAARVGIHRGAVILRRNPPDAVARGAKALEVDGLAKPLAARVMALAAGGQTLLTESAAATLRPALPSGQQLRSHGHYRLKGIDEPLALFELGDERRGFVPPADVDKAYRVVDDGGLWKPAREIRHNLAPERDAFVGRMAEMHRLGEVLEEGARLVSVLGVGGTGKTRFVRRYARSRLGDWPGGVYFCDLSEARSVEGICFAVATALDVPLGTRDPVARLGHAIAGRDRCLVILDNFEQVAGHAAATLGRWLDAARDAAFVVTSRTRLQLAGEDVFALEPLSPASEAIELFAARAASHQPGFALDAAGRTSVESIARLLDGLPLALELAAARIRVLSPSQILQRLEDRFTLLAGARGTIARQATLRAAIDWSWDLLLPWEQAALAQSAVFEGGFTLEAAEAVLDLSAWPQAGPVLDTVQALVDQSLLRSWRQDGTARLDIDEPYFGLYLSIREYAAGKLAGDAALSAERRHGHWFASLGAEDRLLSLRQEASRMRALAIDIDNLVAACKRAVGRADGATAAGALAAACTVFDFRGPRGAGVELAQAVLGIAQRGAQRRAALLALAIALHAADRRSDARASLESCIDEAEQAQDLNTLARARRRLGTLCKDLSQYEQAHHQLHTALALFEQLGDTYFVARTWLSLGHLCLEAGQLAHAEEHLHRCMAMCSSVVESGTEAQALGALGNVYLSQGRLDDARHMLERSIAINRRYGHEQNAAIALNSLSVVMVLAGRHDEAAPCFEELIAIARATGARSQEAIARGNLGAVRREQGRIDEGIELMLQARAAHQRLGNRSFEANVQRDLAIALRRAGRVDDARQCCDDGIAIARSLDDGHLEGTLLGELAECDLHGGRLAEAGALLSAAEPLLRAVGAELALAEMLCTRGRLERRTGQADSAQATLAEADAVARARAAEPASIVGRALAALRAELGAHAD